MRKVTMLRIEHNEQSVEIIDFAPDYGSIRNALGDAVIETPLDGAVVALTAANESEQIICTWRDLAFVGSVMLITAKAADGGGYRSLNAEEINKYMYEFGGELL